MTDERLSISELIKLADDGIRLVISSEVASDRERDALMDTIALSSAASLLAIAKLLNYRFIGLLEGNHD